MTIQAVIVDDEPLARKRIREFLSTEEDIEVIAECANGSEALAVIQSRAPNLLFLDIEMPDMDGFGLIEAVGPSRMPPTVFVTAYDEYAVAAFEMHAVDYLLKPFDRARFQGALQQVRHQLERNRVDDLNQQLEALLADLRSQERYVDRLAVKAANRVVFLPVDELEWVDAAGNYVRLNSQGTSYLLRHTISALEKKLDPQVFVRIHRSTIVNVEQVVEIRPLQHGEYLLLLKGGQRLNVSRGYRHRVDALLN